VTAHLLRVQKRHPDLVKVREVAVTTEKRPIYAVTITDHATPDSGKQHVLMTAGHHGNEESGRMIALSVIDWLASKAAEETRRKQKIVVMPNMNPDMAERDAHVQPEGTAPMRDHSPEGPKTPEGVAFEGIAYELEPELYVDMHARGFAGCSYDMVLWAEPAVYTEDDYLLHRIAAEMAEAGEKAGIPNIAHPLSWPGFMSESPDVSSANAFAYRNFKSISILTETSESNQYAYPAKDRGKSGRAKIKALLAWGNRRHPKLYYPGYPCYLAGMFHKGLVAVGETASARRRSRVAIWRERSAFKTFDLRGPERPDEKRLTVAYEGRPLTAGVGFQTSIRGKRKVDYVGLNGEQLASSETNGYYTWQHGCATFIVVARAKFQPGEYEIVIRHHGA